MFACVLFKKNEFYLYSVYDVLFSFFNPLPIVISHVISIYVIRFE